MSDWANWRDRFNDLSKRETRAVLELSIKWAEEVLPIYEKTYPNDARPRQALEAGKHWLKHGIGFERFVNLASEAADQADGPASSAAFACGHCVSYASAVNTPRGAAFSAAICAGYVALAQGLGYSKMKEQCNELPLL